MALLAGSFDADGWVAARSLECAAAGGPLDVAYLARLSEDASSALPLPKTAFAEGDETAAYLGIAWSQRARAHRDAGWRSWRGMGTAGRSIDWARQVGANDARATSASSAGADRKRAGDDRRFAVDDRQLPGDGRQLTSDN
jgi:hypothetical protein